MLRNVPLPIPRYVHDGVVLSFPTRRSSDLGPARLGSLCAAEAAGPRPLRQPGGAGRVRAAPPPAGGRGGGSRPGAADRKSTRLNSSHVSISYAVCCWKKKTISTIRSKGILV